MEKTRTATQVEVGTKLQINSQVLGELHGSGGMQRDVSSLLLSFKNSKLSFIMGMHSRIICTSQ